MGNAASVTPRGNHDNTKIVHSVDFPKLGVTISLFDEFIQQCGGTDALKDKTTTDVCELFLKPMTSESQKSYCDQLHDKRHPSVGIAQVFISHAWKFKFLEVFEALKYHFRSQPSIIIWFDLFSNNQHKAVDLDFNWWCNTFKSAIRDFNHVVMVLAPWNNPVPLTRAWCLFELYCSADSHSRFEVAMSRAEQETFLSDMEVDTQVKINSMVSTIDCAQSECFKPEDRERIFTVVRESVGFQKINSMVFEQLRQWVVDTTLTALSNTTDPLKQATLQLTLAELLRGQGKYTQAEQYYSSCIETRTAMLGEEHPDTLTCKSHLGVLYYQQGKYNHCEASHNTVYESRLRVLGADHLDTILSLNNLASYHLSKLDRAKAEPLYRLCYDKRVQLQGVNHPDTLRTYCSLACAIERPEAETIYLECLERQRAVLGDAHIDTINTVRNLANYYISNEQLARAENMKLFCIETLKVKLGDEHPDTLTAIHEAALLYHNHHTAEKYAQAASMYQDCLDKRVRQLGPTHPETLKTMSYLAVVLNLLQETERAEIMFVTCREGLIASLGQDHPDTVYVTNCLGSLYLFKEQYSLAEPLLKSAYRERKIASGDCAVETLESLNNLAMLYFNQNQYDKAEPYCVTCYENRLQSLGTDHPLTLSSQHLLATTYHCQGNVNSTVEHRNKLFKALPLYETCLQRREKVLGTDHSDTEGTRKNLALLIQIIGTNDTPLSTASEIKCDDVSAAETL